VVAAVDVPLNVDAEYCFSADIVGIGPVVRRLASTGAAGFSIEDFNPFVRVIDPVEVAAERVAAAAAAAHDEDLVLTARAENLLYGAGDLDDTITRMLAYRDAGADVVYAPGLVDLSEIATVVAEVGVPVNVLILPGGPSIPELAATGVRRVSTGGALARSAYTELRRLATALLAAAESTEDGALSVSI
jgi:2-methylisocitrate lyase-like PEP mutase family enzyme